MPKRQLRTIRSFSRRCPSRRLIMADSIPTDTHADADHAPARGLMRWITTTNHKDIGTLYLVLSGTLFIIGGIFALVVRSELFEPGMQIVDPYFFNEMTT